MKIINLSQEKIINIALFASGAGSNAQKIIDYFKNHSYIKVALIVCNNPKAGVLAIAEKESVPAIIIEKNWFEKSGYINELHSYNISFIVLAGFLWKIPPILIKKYPDGIVNIHPALLPDYGGKGMYGNAVHKAVIEGKETESGITIHIVDEIYDNGKILFQVKCPVVRQETPESLATKVHVLEHSHYSKQIEKILKEKFISGKIEN